VREAALFSVQEQQRVLAADAAPHQGSYQPLLAAAPPAVGSKARFRWPDHHAADLRHIDRSAFRSSPSCGSLAGWSRLACESQLLYKEAASVSQTLNLTIAYNTIQRGD
jgi:hypothetical protein